MDEIRNYQAKAKLATATNQNKKEQIPAETFIPLAGNSFIGIMGSRIDRVIRPLGYD